MIKAAVVLCAFIALAIAQDAFPLTGPMTNAFTEGSNPYAVHVYIMQLNESMATIDIEITPENECDFTLYVSGREFPCGDVWSAPSDFIYPCRGNSNSQDSVYTEGVTSTLTVFPSSYSDDMFVNLASNLYITVVRQSYYVTDYCNYTIAPVVSSCPSGQVALDGDATDCVPLTNLGTVASAIISPRNGAGEWTYYKIAIPSMAASVHFYGNLTTNPTIYVSQKFVPFYYSSYYDASFTGSSTTDGYEFDDYFWNPEMGTLYFGVYGSVDEGNLTVTVRTCSGNMGGWNCSYPLNVITSPSTMVSNTFTITNTEDDIPCVYYVLNVAPGDFTSYVNYTIQYTSGDFYTFYRKNGFVENLDYNYVNSKYVHNLDTEGESITYALTPADLALGGQFVLGVQNYDSTVGASSSGNITSAFMSSTTTGSGSTTASGSTTEATGTTGDSGVSAVAYCFALIALCIAALF